jgi:threonine dehydratase
MQPIGRDQIARMYEVVKPHIRKTPVLNVSGADFGLLAFPLTLKLESLQHAGSFKTRGAFAHLLTRDVPPVGVVAASGGNHGVAVAYAASRLGVPATIFVPNVASPAKIARIQAYGSDLKIVGERYADALRSSENWAKTTGAMPIHAFDEIETVLGQGTLALELSAQAPGIDTLFFSVGGGGLIAGGAAWYAGSVRVMGVEPEKAPTLTHALAAGAPVDAPAGGIAADSLAPARIGELVYPIARAFVEKVFVVTDEEIQRSQKALWDAARILTEPGGAAAFAALLSGAYRPAPTEHVGVILSGGNTTEMPSYQSLVVSR